MEKWTQQQPLKIIQHNCTARSEEERFQMEKQKKKKRKKKTSEPSTFWYLFLRVKQPGGKWKNSPSTIHRNSFKSHVRSGVNNHPMHRCICHFSSVCPLAASVSGRD